MATTTTAATQQQRSESDVYDRQIRLWGADAQAKMSQAKVLYIHVTGLTSEILKNLVLAGIRPAICDVRKVADSTTFLQQTPSFFWAGRLPPQDTKQGSDDEPNGSDDAAAAKKAKHFDTIAELVQPAIEELNPLLGACELVTTAVADLTAEQLQAFSVIVASQLTPQQALELRSKLTEAQKLFWVDSFGWHASCWVDWGSATMTFRPEKGKELLEPQTLKPYWSLQQMYDVPLHEAVNRFHKVTPPPSLTYHKALLAFCEHQKQGLWMDALGGNGGDDDGKVQDFVKYIRDEWLPATSPSLLSTNLFSKDALEAVGRQAASGELIAICSVAGGMVGNEIIKAISGKGTPANNTISFDGTTGKGWYFLLQKDARKKAPPSSSKS